MDTNKESIHAVYVEAKLRIEAKTADYRDHVIVAQWNTAQLLLTEVENARKMAIKKVENNQKKVMSLTYDNDILDSRNWNLAGIAMHDNEAGVCLNQIMEIKETGEYSSNH
jgi:hypothetical protein